MTWDWLLYTAFAAAFERGYWFERRHERRNGGRRARVGDGSMGAPKVVLSTLDVLLPLLHEEAERLLGPDYIAGKIGGIEAAWCSLQILAHGRSKLVGARP